MKILKNLTRLVIDRMKRGESSATRKFIYLAYIFLVLLKRGSIFNDALDRVIENFPIESIA